MNKINLILLPLLVSLCAGCGVEDRIAELKREQVTIKRQRLDLYKQGERDARFKITKLELEAMEATRERKAVIQFEKQEVQKRLDTIQQIIAETKKELGAEQIAAPLPSKGAPSDGR